MKVFENKMLTNVIRLKKEVKKKYITMFLRYIIVEKYYWDEQANVCEN